MAEWFKQRSDYYEQPDMLTAGEKAEVLYMRAKAYCAHNATSGYIPEAMLPRLTPEGWKRRAAALVAVGLWQRTQGGYFVVDWDDDQADLEAFEARKRADAARQRARRQRLKEEQNPPRPPRGTDSSRDQSEDASRDASRDEASDWHDLWVKEGQSAESYPPVDQPVTGPDDADVIPLYPTGHTGQSPASSQASRDSHVTDPRPVRGPRVREENNYPPNPPHSGGNPSPPQTRCTRHLARPKAWCPDCQRPPLEPMPAWCGECDSDGYRWVLDHDRQPLRKCPRCHPETVRYA